MNAFTRLEIATPEGKAVELFVAEPAGPPRGAVLFVHGHQDGARPGGRVFAEDGALAGNADAWSVVAASVSQPGYGGSDGPPDFCGPVTQAAVRLTLDHLAATYGIKRRRTILLGISRGATVAAMVATREPELGGLVLVSGAYDMEAVYATTLPGIRDNIEREAGTSAGAFRERSALHHAASIRAETCILHGRGDDRLPVGQAERFAAALSAFAPVRLALLECGHAIPPRERRQAVLPTFWRVFGSQSPTPAAEPACRPGR